MIGIRADGNASIGMGHLMRCFSIAVALREKNIPVIFFTDSLESLALIEERGIPCEFVKPVDEFEDELSNLIHLIHENNIKMLLVDSYRATPDYMLYLKKEVFVIYIDDIAAKVLPADCLINYNIYGDALPYKELYDESTALLLGSRFAPVKREFSEMDYRLKEHVNTILITMGGSDSLNIAGQIGELLLNVIPESIEIILICGRFSPHYSLVRELELKSKRVSVLTDVKDMWNVMVKADIAIAAAGSTMYELCTLGVPSVCCYYVENQRLIAEAFGVRTSMVNAGDFSENPNLVLQNIKEEVIKLINDYPKRKLLSEEMHNITDGKGANRIADYFDRMLASGQVL